MAAYGAGRGAWIRSPISRVDDIRTPLMVVQGGNDVRVVKAGSERIVDIDVYRAADRFLARHLG
ncbi:hypothetical protein ABZ349_21035 [Streptomyces niveus]|uniref:alpha/beta hydrolase family protein n=1 Tax=Streptomyces niveus TaxID=193462 RepID=UPI0033D55046